MDAQVEQVTIESKKAVEEIQLDTSKSDDLLSQIEKLEAQKATIEFDIRSTDAKISEQKYKNQTLRQKIEDINEEFKSKIGDDRKVLCEVVAV